MITTVDRGKNDRDWATIDWENDEIVYDESGMRKKIDMSDFIFTAGKYKGHLLSEVSDSWYLKFIKEKNPDDHLISIMFGRRLKELQ